MGQEITEIDVSSWEIEIKRLRKLVRKKSELIKKLKSGEEYKTLTAKLEKNLKERQALHDYIDDLYGKMDLKDTLYYRSEDAYKRLHDKFEANFKFHEYIKDVLVQTADLMEKHDAVREQGKAVQKRVQAAGRKRRTREPNGASAGASSL